MNRKRYPKNWDAIAREVKEKVNWNCEWCGRPCIRPGENIFDLDDRLGNNCNPKTGHCWADDLWENYEPHIQRFRLTVAHLDHDPENPNARLAALCAPCHCRYDLKQMPRKRQIERERRGQLSLFNLESN